MRSLASSTALVFLFVSLLSTLSAGCAIDQVMQASADGSGIYAFAMTEATPPLAMTDDATLYWVENRMEFPLTPPNAEELAALGAEAPAPYPTIPWVLLGDIDLEVDLVVTNLMEERRTVDLTLNGINEFHEYVPAFIIDGDEIISDFAQWERTVVIEAGEQYQVTITGRQLTEVATDLATVVNGAPNANAVVYFENQSGIPDPRIDPYIPETIPGLVGLRLGIRASSATPPSIVVEASLRLIDREHKVSDDVEDPEQVWMTPAPEIFTPVPLEEE